MSIHDVLRPILLHFRRSRMARFDQMFAPSPDTAILDVGGTPFNWSLIDRSPHVTMINLVRKSSLIEEVNADPNLSYIIADGTCLPFADGAFDISYSNSVIEHLYSYEGQARFAQELSRVGNGVWVQTPARSFIIEPHLITPLIHFAPRSWQRRLIRNFTTWGRIVRPSQAEVDQFLDEVRLLTYREMCEIFPDCEIQREKFLFMTKAYVAVRT